MSRLVLAALGLTVLSFDVSRASAQVIYEPVQYQYGTQDPYYYGGDDPGIHGYAAQLTHEQSWGRVNGFAFASGNYDTHREVVTERPRVYSDQLPYRNAFIYGYTPTDARNEAYDRVPRYFVKKDLIAGGVRMPDGAVIVPAHTEPRPDLTEAAPTPKDATRPAPILIIPKSLIDKPAPKTVATAD
jgi:hypothetical protein